MDRHQEAAEQYRLAAEQYRHQPTVDPRTYPLADGPVRLNLTIRNDLTRLNDLAWLLATCPYPELRDPEQAVELATKAVARSLPLTVKEFWNTLGVAQYRAGHWADAVAALEKSMQVRNDSAHDWFFLAMAHWQLGDKEEARDWYDKAVAWMDTNKPRDEELLRFRAEAAQLLGVESKKD
jgi:tetratricopeptide (TPR) repeat protein